MSRSGRAAPTLAVMALVLWSLGACHGQQRSASEPARIHELVEGIVPIYEGPESTGFGMFGITPESPDGERIVYVRFERLADSAEAGGVPAELWVCNRDLSQHRKLADVTIPNHNGARAFWIDEERIAFHEEAGIFVIDSKTGERVLGPYEGELGHSGHEGRILFYGRAAADDVLGIHELDTTTGQVRRVIDLPTLERRIQDETGSSLGGAVHLQYSTDGSWISFRGLAPTASGPLMASMTPDGDEVVVFSPPKPLHQLWYDAVTYMGVWRGSGVPAEHNWHYHRWDIRGRRLEKLAGRINHGAASPDRQWYAGGTAAYGAVPIRLALYQRGDTTATAVLWEYAEPSPVWVRETHVNPSFSRDGRRLYFWMPISPDKVQAAYVDISHYSERRRE